MSKDVLKKTTVGPFQISKVHTHVYTCVQELAVSVCEWMNGQTKTERNY